MSGFLAGIISVATLLVGAAIVTTLVKNPQGSAGLINAVTSGFSTDLLAAQGSSSFSAPTIG
jgi:hypothetical protein